MKRRAQPIALQVAPNFSADCAEVDHGLHDEYAKANVLAFWRLMNTRSRFQVARDGPCAVDKRLLGSTSFGTPTIRAGAEPSEFDRHLGLADLVEAFESGATRTELYWVRDGAKGWKERERVCKKRPRNCDWAFAMIEMLLDPVLSAWIPQWIVEQYERRNPAFRGIVERELTRSTICRIES